MRIARAPKGGCGKKGRERVVKRFLAVIALVAVVCTMLGCGDPTVELLEGPATSVASDEEAPLAYEAELCVGEARIRVLVADTLEERAAGLSGYEGLPEDAGMLFVFPEPQQPSFWMRGMEFALDIIWIRDGAVVQIHAAVPPASSDTPDSNLPRYRPEEPVTHALELTAGSAARLGITVGSRIAPCPNVSPTPNGGN